MTDARAVVALGALHAIARQVSYPTARVARLLATTSTAAEIAVTSTSGVAIPRPTARRLGARACNVANLATAVALRPCAATAGSTPESAGTGLGLRAIARLCETLREKSHRVVGTNVQCDLPAHNGSRISLSVPSYSLAIRGPPCHLRTINKNAPAWT
ncbi:hypothetical protein EDB86DRAFT_2911599 [Lactarius hatsudake]|nr:hypothetical protein EDB86DRAFT_2911599 [Lactarius hatsudake]